MRLENPWISGVWFKGLESTWNWFWFLNVLDLFIKQNRKISTLISFEVNENKCSGIQKIKFSKCLQNVWKHLFFFVPIVLSLPLHMSIEPLMYSECQVCTWFQAPIFWCFCMCTCLCPKQSFQHNILQSRVLENPWKVLAWKSVWAHPVTYFSCTQYCY